MILVFKLTEVTRVWRIRDFKRSLTFLLYGLHAVFRLVHVLSYLRMAFPKYLFLRDFVYDTEYILLVGLPFYKL